MQRPRLGFTLAALMVLVALVAAGLGLWRRAESLRHRAAEHSSLARRYAEMPRIVSTDAEEQAAERMRRQRDRLLSSYHKALKDKYERAARRPWLPVEPDPPPSTYLFSGGH